MTIFTMQSGSFECEDDTKHYTDFCKISASWPLSSKKKNKRKRWQNDLCKIHVGLYIASFLQVKMNFTYLVTFIVCFCSIMATRPNICKMSVCFYCITTSLWKTPVNYFNVAGIIFTEDTWPIVVMQCHCLFSICSGEKQHRKCQI